MGKFIYLFLFLSLGSVQLQAQSVSGSITDAYSGVEIPNVRVSIQNDLNQYSILADIGGFYQIDSILPGRYQFVIEQEGYQLFKAQGILISSGKSLHFNHALIPSPFEMETVIVQASDTWESRSGGQVEVIGIEETERFAANFQDPARVVNTHAGIAQLNDQANHLFIRGLSPFYSKWYLEGMEIVNPNHTSNAGTLSDLPTQAGGGVLLFSSQVLGNTILSKGPHAVQYCNALSGIVDLNYRNPSLDETKYAASLSLIGVEAIGEGPIAKSKKSSWMANYRYSTIGLLSAMGVPLGDEDIRFQDAHVQMNIETGKHSSLRLFGFWGNNENVFEGKEDPAEREETKERFDIDFESSIYGIGAKYRSILGANAILKAGTVFSSYSAERKEQEILDGPDRSFSQFLDQDNKILSSFIERQSKSGNAGRLTIGLQHKWIDDASQNETLVGGIVQDARSISERQMLRPYIDYLIDLSTNISLTAGIASAYWTNGNSFIVEPQLGIVYHSGASEISLRYQRRSQDFVQPIISINQVELENTTIQPAVGHLVNLGFSNSISQVSRISGSLFYTYISQAPVYGNIQYASQVFDFYPIPGVTYIGKERTYGIEASYDRAITSDFFISSNVTLYKSEIETPKKGWHNSRFDGQYILNLNMGKEFVKSTEKHHRTFGISGRLTILGGILDREIDETQSALAETTIYASELYEKRLPTYFRPDLSIYILKNKKNRTIRWSLDIQNVANIENTAYYYYDAVAQGVVEKNQLGIIPILSWRIGF